MTDLNQDNDCRYDSLPKHLRGGIKRYLEEGILPGSFLQAVITNNLFRAVGAADEESKKHLVSIVAFMYYEAPSNCWGSRRKMLEWAKRKALTDAELIQTSRDIGWEEVIE